jgi:hypothetical protein
MPDWRPIPWGGPISHDAARTANVGAAMIAHRAKHPPLQLPKGQVVGEPADVQFGVMIQGGFTF